MNIQEYIDQKKELYSLLMTLIENENDNYQDFFNFIEKQKITENREEFKSLLYLILNISNDHQRSANFFNKIEKILLNYSNEIKQTFSNVEILDFFECNKRILFFLFDNEMLNIDENLINCLFESHNSRIRLYLYKKIKNKIDEDKKNTIEKELLKIEPTILENFEEKCKIGENDSYICQLIRNDSVEEFITYVTRTNLSLLSRIKESVFETNSFLLNKEPSLIEYSAFFGSIQIFQYLKLNRVDLTSSLWLYAIHGKNGELIHLLEENEVQPPDSKYNKCLEEAIKCHHNDIAVYINNNLINEKNLSNEIDYRFNENICSYSLHYYNYYFFPNDLNHEFMLFYLCQYDYYKLVKFLLDENKIDLNAKLIMKRVFIKFKINVSYLISK